MLWWFAQTTLIAGGLAVLATLGGRWKRFGPEARHALWLVVLIKLALPPVVAWPWGLPDTWPARAEAAPIASPAPAPTPPVVEVASPTPEVPVLPEPPPPLDLPAIVGVMLFVALVYTLANLVVDVLYGVIDPRVRLA